MNVKFVLLLSIICLSRAVYHCTKMLYLSMQNIIKIGLIKEYNYTCSCSKWKKNKMNHCRGLIDLHNDRSH